MTTPLRVPLRCRNLLRKLKISVNPRSDFRFWMPTSVLLLLNGCTFFHFRILLREEIGGIVMGAGEAEKAKKSHYPTLVQALIVVPHFMDEA